MSFSAPLAFLLTGLLGIIVVFYLLKLRRIERRVSSVYLWRRMVRDLEANVPWQRLRRNILLFLQLLFLTVLILSLSRPFTYTNEIAAQAAILILDNSASMGATDTPPNRLGYAKELAHQFVDNLSEDTRVTVIAAGSKAKVVVNSSLDRLQIQRQIDAIQLEAGGSDMAVALQLASAISARQSDSLTNVFSDGNVVLPDRLSFSGVLRFTPIGTHGENQAISLLTLEPAPGGRSATVFAQVINYSSEAARRRIAFYQDGELFNAVDLDLPPGKEQAVIAEGVFTYTQIIEAQLVSSENTLDYLPTDDRALAVQRASRPARVSLVTPDNLFLEAALSLLPGVQLTRIQPAEASTLPEADLTIIDGSLPITPSLNAGNLFFIGPLSSTEYFKVTGLLTAPLAEAASSEVDHPLLANVSLDGINILDAAKIPLPDWATPVIVATDQGFPLLLSGETNGRKVAVLAFNLLHSDLPLQIAFPILLSNLIQWLAPGTAGAAPPQVKAGQVLTFYVPPSLVMSEGIPRLSITFPDGREVILESYQGKSVFSDTSQLGLYPVAWVDQLEEPSNLDFSVNLSSSGESAIQPKDSLPLNLAAQAQTSTEGELAHREWWRPVALLALLVLTIEWLVYQRPAIKMISQRILSR